MERAIKYILILGAVAGIFFALGSAGAIASGTVSLTQGAVQALAGFAVSILCLNAEEVI